MISYLDGHVVVPLKETFNPWFLGIVGGTGLLTALVPSSMILLNASTLFVKNIYQIVLFHYHQNTACHAFPGFAPDHHRH